MVVADPSPHFVWWMGLAVAVVCGALGGLVNALLAGGERYRITLPFKQGREVAFGVLGPIVVGLTAGIVAWGGALRQSEPAAVLVGCILAGISGGNFLTSQIRIRNLASATQDAAQAAAAFKDVAVADLTAESAEGESPAPVPEERTNE